MIAIETRYIGPTNTKPSRIIASTCNGQRLVMSASAAENIAADTKLGYSAEDAHHAVARALADSMQWPGKLIGGGTKSGYVFVFVD